MSATLEACDVLSCASADPLSLHINAEELAGGLCAAADEPRRAAATVELLGKDTAGAHARDATRARLLRGLDGPTAADTAAEALVWGQATAA